VNETNPYSEPPPEPANRQDPIAARAIDLAGALQELDPEALKHFAALAPELAPEAPPDMAPVPSANVPTADPSGQLEELADDMLSLLKRVKSLEELQGQVLGRIDQLQSAVERSSEVAAREADSLRRELLGQRKHIAQMSAFQAVVTGLERLQVMRGELDTHKDNRMIGQLDAVLQTLGTMLRGLGFVEFRAEVQEPFDPTRMECLGYASGEPNVVLKCLRSGYRADQTVVRPAGVLIANPLQK
jgi:molecular chaperone GrpE (heat shock protein)